MKKLKKILVWAIIVFYLILISGFVAGRRNITLCNKVNVIICDSLSKRFLDQKDITELLSENNKLSLGTELAKINTNEIETLVLKNSLVKKCYVYKTVDGVLNIESWQREPLVRIIDSKGQNYYLDVDGSVISMSRRFTPHLLVVNGYINTPFDPNSIDNIYSDKYDKSAKILRNIHELSGYIEDNEFWKSQIVQLYIDKNHEIEIVPRIGPHIIQLGPIDNFVRKLEKLRIFYTEGLNNVGWNKYLKINLKYKDQIVCTKI